MNEIRPTVPKNESPKFILIKKQGEQKPSIDTTDATFNPASFTTRLKREIAVFAKQKERENTTEATLRRCNALFGVSTTAELYARSKPKSKYLF